MKHPAALTRFIEARAEFRDRPTAGTLAVFRVRSGRLAGLMLRSCPVVTPHSRFTPVYDAVEGRWRVREERRKFHGCEQWRVA